MDFVERITGLCPDGGQGWTEQRIVAVLLLLLAALGWRWLSRRAARRQACS